MCGVNDSGSFITKDYCDGQKRMTILAMPQETGVRLAKGAAKGTGYVRTTVFLTHVASPKHVSPLATVHS